MKKFILLLGIEYSKTFTYTANYFPSAASLSYVSWF